MAIHTHFQREKQGIQEGSKTNMTNDIRQVIKIHCLQIRPECELEQGMISQHQEMLSPQLKPLHHIL